MPPETQPYLSPREQQIMELVYSRSEGVVAGDIEQALGVSNSAARTFLRILEQKGHLTHTEASGRFNYFPIRPRTAAGSSALARVAATFFDSSPARVMASLLGSDETQLTDNDIAELQALIDAAREKGATS